MRKKNRTRRREVALANLKAAKFFPKTMRNGKERSEETWEKNRQQQIEVLNERISLG